MTYDSNKAASFIVHKIDGLNVVFKEDRSGLHYYDTKEKKKKIVLVSTVKDKMLNYTDCQIAHAKLVHTICTTVGCPSLADFKNMVRSNLIHNCPITLDNIKVAQDI